MDLQGPTLGGITPLVYCQALHAKSTYLFPGLPVDTTRGGGVGPLFQQTKPSHPVRPELPASRCPTRSQRPVDMQPAVRLVPC